MIQYVNEWVLCENSLDYGVAYVNVFLNFKSFFESL